MLKFFKPKYIALLIICLMILGGGIYFGFIKYQSYNKQKVEQRIEAEKQAKKAQTQLVEQQKAINEAKIEIEKLKTQTLESQKKQGTIEQKVNQTQSKEIIISSSDLAPFLGGMVNISCDGAEGSGTLWNITGKGYVVLTNEHVIENPHYTISDGYFCLVFLEGGLYTISTQEKFTWNNLTDIAAVPLKKITTDKFTVNPIQNLNYKISSLNKCPTSIALGSPVLMVGFPAFTGNQTDLGSIKIDQSFLTVTNGIISAYDTSVKEPFGKLPYANYFISAKIDSGNSGGVVFSKTSNGLCVLGVPTWLTIGNYETQGLVQNIYNIMYQQ